MDRRISVNGGQERCWKEIESWWMSISWGSGWEKSDGKKIRWRGKVNKESMTEWQLEKRPSERGGERDNTLFFFFLFFSPWILNSEVVRRRSLCSRLLWMCCCALYLERGYLAQAVLRRRHCQWVTSLFSAWVFFFFFCFFFWEQSSPKGRNVWHQK